MALSTSNPTVLFIKPVIHIAGDLKPVSVGSSSHCPNPAFSFLVHVGVAALFHFWVDSR